MLVFSLLFMQAIYRTLSYDIKLEGAVHISKDLLRRLSNDIVPRDPKSMVYNPLFQLMAAEPIPRSNKKEDELQVKSSKPRTEDIAPTTNKVIEMEPTKDPGKFKTDEQKVRFRFKLINQVSESGTDRLKMLAYFLKNQLHPKSDIESAVNNATQDSLLGYLSQIEAYYAFISKKPVMYHIDKEFIVLDIIETTNKILLHEAKKLLDAMINVTKTNEEQIDITLLMEKITKTVLGEKQDLLMYVCREISICRTFPGYCDHIADMLSELLQLTDKNFKEFILTLNETITIKRDFFKTILRENVYNELRINLNNSINNVNYMKEVFSIIRAVITHRYKVFTSDSVTIKVKTKAVRILFDLIDKAFDLNDNDISNIDIENTISSYKQWALGERDDVGMITKKFVYNAVETLNYYWGSETKEEAKVLTDVIFTGGTENVGVYNYLFTNGSTINHDLA